MPQLQQRQQALGRQVRVEGQVTRPGLEGAQHHAQQFEAALGQQGHRLVNSDARHQQRMAQLVRPLIQHLVGPALIQTCGNHLLRVRRQLRFK